VLVQAVPRAPALRDGCLSGSACCPGAPSPWFREGRRGQGGEGSPGAARARENRRQAGARRSHRCDGARGSGQRARVASLPPRVPSQPGC
jgi:hypothetical protein